MTAAFIIGTIAFATILQGITGFGYGLLAAPILLILVTKTVSVTTLITTGIGLNAFLLWHLRAQAIIDRRLFRWLLGSTMLGMPFGILILKFVDTHTMRIVAGVSVVAFAILFYRRIVVISRTNRVTAVAGWFAGILQTSIGLAGAPVALLLSGQERAKDEMRKTLAAFFLVINVIAISTFYGTGMLSEEGLLFGVASIPGAFLGAYIGSRIARRISQRQFIRLTFALISVTGLVAVYSGFSL